MSATDDSLNAIMAAIHNKIGEIVVNNYMLDPRTLQVDGKQADELPYSIKGAPALTEAEILDFLVISTPGPPIHGLQVDPWEGRKVKAYRVLDLPIQAHWREMIASGVKKTEYRRDCPHWRSRTRHLPDIVTFRNYTHRDRLYVECLGIDYDHHGRADWGADPDTPCIGIHLGRIIYDGTGIHP